MTICLSENQYHPNAQAYGLASTMFHNMILLKKFFGLNFIFLHKYISIKHKISQEIRRRQPSHISTVLPTKSDSDVMFCLQS